MYKTVAVYILYAVKLEVKKLHYRPGQAQRVPEG